MTSRAADLAHAAARAVDADLAIELARSLVRIDSVVRPATGGGEAACVAWIESYLRGRGLAPAVHEALPGRPNLVADVAFAGRPARRRRRRLLFEGHTDVVTEGDLALWSRDPFGAEIADGRLYGRGACDMKGGLAAALAAIEALRRVAPDLPGDIRLACLADEEGMMRGVKRFIEQGLARDVDGAIVCEPEELELCLVQKGAMRVVVDLAGRMAHGAMPYAGANPIPAAAEVVRGAVRLDGEIRARTGVHPYLGAPHLTPTILAAPPAGEAQLNVVPARAQVGLDVRTVPGQDHRALERDLRAL
ncbi:MAG TPA: M20/M25/M40 family metallo-hydrolase, partial [Thermodesulfobacteriota bacterium]